MAKEKVVVVIDLDWAVLDDPAFKEDSVREEILAPILRHLGFRPDRDPKVVRSKSLTHPYVMLGSSRRSLSIIPDYTLYRRGEARIVLDAKSPGEDVFKGEHVAQAYSYAIHPEIRAPVYSLCNGRHMTLFHIYSPHPMRVYDLKCMAALDWRDMQQKLGEVELTRIEAFDFLLDFGVCFELLGFDLDAPQMFLELPVYAIGKVSDSLYTLNSKAHFMQDREVLLTADVTAEHLDLLQSGMSDECRAKCRRGLSEQPFYVDISRFGYCATFHGRLSERLEQSRNGEVFRPLVVTKVIVQSH